MKMMHPSDVPAAAVFEEERLTAILGETAACHLSWQLSLVKDNRRLIFDMQDRFRLSSIAIQEAGALLSIDGVTYLVASGEDLRALYFALLKVLTTEQTICGASILEVHAETGLRALTLLQAGAAFVHCFESDPEKLRLLKWNLLNNAQFAGRYAVTTGDVTFDTENRGRFDVELALDSLLCEQSSGSLALSIAQTPYAHRILGFLQRTERLTAFDAVFLHVDESGSQLTTPLLAGAGFQIAYMESPSGLLHSSAWIRQHPQRAPEVSVVIPAFNASHTIDFTVRRILNQTYRDLEVIVVDDGSTDDTVESLSRISDPRLKVVSTTNGGQARARNAGIKTATGRYVGFCDADDLWLPRKLQRQVRTLKLHPECELTYSWAGLIDEAGSTIRVASTTSIKGDVYNSLFLANFFECGSTPLATRRVLDSVGLFDESVTRSEDWDMWLRMAKVTKVVATPFVDVLYRQLRNSQSTNVDKLAISCYDVHRKFKATVPQKYIVAGHRNVAMYLAFKAIDPNGGFLLSMKYLLKGLWHHPLFFFTEPKAYRVLLRMLAQLLLPAAAIELLISASGDLLSVDSLLGIVGTSVQEELS